MKLWHSPDTTSTWCLMRRLTKAADNADIDFSILGVSTWYQESTREEDDTHFPSSSRVSDALTGADTTSYQVQEPIENDEEKLAMKRGDMPPPVPQRVVNPRIREDQALHEFYSNSDKMHCATPDDEFTQAWFDYDRSSFPQSVRKTGTNVELFNVPTYQWHPLQQHGSVWPESEFWRPENLLPEVKSSMSHLCHLSRNFGETTTCMWFWQQKLTAYRQTKRSCLRTMAWWDSPQAEPMICESTKELILQGMFVSCGIKWRRRQKNACSDFWNKFAKKAEGAMTDSRERTADTL